MPKITINGTLICMPDDVEIVAAALPAHIEASRAEPGCLAFNVTQSGDDPCVFDVHEVFRDAAALEAHTARTRASEWWRITAHIPRDLKVSGT